MDGARYLEDGRLTVFLRNGTYYARLRLSPGKYVTRSLKTTVEENAVQAGRRLLFQLEQRADDISWQGEGDMATARPQVWR
ncbi:MULTISPECIES: hypothetical protein [unclassified Bradyrhizobium]|uniref:hypothetical protein n=1 Tax=unclassified Bradyrhizobium TaxID=2631580 RepID=UPI001FF974DE|nr:MULTISPECIES: hypothetical protein [unclassified Bradyrhizobium]MCK1309982.1 hypothetical protein [Bradyrhizobium sp. 45]MCK1433868.1 hypothetical protein [Bradyrhizobium sp. 15]MCK1614992.1 hypothetical protein [Bradyrhizobium sp. 163]MCK1764771.1 hypothetical protein [Bradyrhizobium sp. 136]